MQRKEFLKVAFAAALMFSVSKMTAAHADDDTLEQTEKSANDTIDKPEWYKSVQDKYSLTDDQMNSMKDKGYKGPQLAMIAGLSSKSGKSIDEIMQMRGDQNMGWGKIAKELGVAPKEIGQSVADLHRQVKEGRHERREDREERRAEHMEKRKEHMEKRKERMEKRSEHMEKRKERMEKRSERRKANSGKSN